MKPRALLVEDEAGVAESVKDILESLGHEYDHAPDMETARMHLQKNRYQYVLLDREIPVKMGRITHLMNGDNLFEEIQKSPTLREVPVIIFTGNDVDGPDKAVDMVKAGAFDYVAKSAKTNGKTLDTVIKRAVEASPVAAPESSSAVHSREKKFSGGPLVLFDNRAELCGVTIITDRNTGQTMMLLRELAQKRPDGRWVNLSGVGIMKAIGAEGIGAITGAVKTLRKNCAKRLKKTLNLKCGKDDVIINDEQGYRLQDWITQGDAPVVRKLKNASPAKGVPQTIALRRRRIEQELRKSGGMTAVALAEKIGAADRTIARDIEAMIADGVKIQRERSKKTGVYHIRDSISPTPKETDTGPVVSPAAV